MNAQNFLDPVPTPSGRQPNTYAGDGNALRARRAGGGIKRGLGEDFPTRKQNL